MILCFRASLLLCLVVVLAGCGPSETRLDAYPVSGTVNYDGAPLPEGRIFFEDPTRGVNAGMDIKQGAFSGKVPPGDAKARVVRTETGKDPMSGEERVLEKEVLQSDISFTIKTGDNKLPAIDIPKKAS
jgi:hypothetical protein